MNKLLSILLAGMLLFGGTVQAQKFDRAAPLREPAPLVPMTKLSAVAMHDAIKSAAEDRKWQIVDDQPGRLEAKYDPGRGFWITIAITYDPQQVRISYLDSEGLAYRVEEGQRLIHTNVNGWLYGLIAAITVNLLRAEPLEQ